jgi:diadenosine tetraphosphate (Ap4A) HIT family hydrolase
MQMIIFENHELYIEKHESEIPWVKIFTKEPYRELTDVPHELRKKLWEMYDIVEEEMRLYYKPKKINMASFANMLPRVHIHVMARFEHDSHFPNPMWGEQQRQSSLNLPNEEKFHEQLFNALNKRFHM